MKDSTLVVHQTEANVRVSNRMDAYLVFDVAKLGVLSAQEFASGGDVEEEGTDFDLCARGFARFFDGGKFAPVDGDFCACKSVGFTSGHAKLGDAGDARHGFTAKAHGEDVGEVFGFANLAGCMPLEGHQGVSLGHATTIVGNVYRGDAATANAYFDIASAGIDAVFDEFFDNGGGALYDFASGDLAGERIREEFDLGHADVE